MERELKNGARYYFYQFGSKVYTECFYNGKWNRITREFNSFKEASDWCDEEDYKFENPEEWKPAAPPANYYDDCRRYYGD